MENIAEHLITVRRRIEAACTSAGRSTESVTLLAVSKTFPAAAIRCAYVLGQRHFGESYLQEALAKQAELRDLNDLVWHFIGPVQSNKTRAIATQFHWLHSLDREKIARRLHAQRPVDLAPLNVCIQVNLDQEATKSGLDASDVFSLAAVIGQLPRLRLQGLMCIPPKHLDRADLGSRFHALQELQQELRQQFPEQPLSTLSMGMSSDLDIAIAQGSTLVRVGTAIFGSRQFQTN